MDVRCSRCGTEYDFDDALVSERGTTVKCTNCGHQFKVYSGGGGGAVAERWIVRKSSGRELVYTSLRELQRAIAQKQVGPNDLLARDGHAARPLRAIAELDPFFQAQGAGRSPSPSQPQVPKAQRTLMGMPPSGSSPVPIAEDTQPDHAPLSDGLEQPSRANPGATPAGGFRRATAPPPPPRAPGRHDQAPEEELTTARRNAIPEPAPEAPRTLGSGMTPSHSGMPPQTPLVTAPRAPVVNEVSDGVSGAFRAYQESFSDESIPSVPTRRRGRALKWFVGTVILAGLAFVGATVGVRYAKKFAPAKVPSTATRADDRVEKLLDEGNRDLTNGDFESAKEQFDKASALAEHDPAVLSALARLEASRADVYWLTLKLLEPSQKAELDETRSNLAERLVRVRKTAEAAATLAPNAPASVRAQIDAFRLENDVPRARALVGSLGSASSDPETAYVLGALDLAEPSPAWPTIVDRLRTAASSEQAPGRARAALVYALASSGANDDARGALAKLGGSGVPHALVERLKAFVDRTAAPASSTSAAPPAAESAAPAASASAAPPSTTSNVPPPVVTHAVDFRRLLEEASAAKRSGDFAKAETLYSAAHQQEPGNVEAVAGLGDVARMRGNTATASVYYDTVLQQNPTYLPTLVASADMKWAAGNRAAALALYKRVANQADPGTPYGKHAAERIAEGSASPSSSSATGSGGSHAAAKEPTPSDTATASPASPPPAEAPPEKVPPPADLPNIDTTDLPGFK